MSDDDLTIPGIDTPLRWLARPERHALPDTLDGRLEIVAGPRTDRFVDPRGLATTLDAPALLMPEPDGDYLLHARTTVGFAATFDAGVLLLWSGPDRFAKLCFEYSPRHQPTVVSVVTRQSSDDANGANVEGGRCWLRIARIGQAYAFHASLDGVRWELARYFELGGAAPASVGFSAQSPTGQGCRVAFDRIRVERRSLAELRDGS
jgi:uncharacterized protein